MASLAQIKKVELDELARQLDVKEAMDPLLREICQCDYIFPECNDSWDATFRLGGSRFGGKPDLPRSMRWPTRLDMDGNEYGHAFFLAQFNLSEIPAIDGMNLPRTGYWWLFYRSGPEAEDQPIIQVIHSPDPGTLETRDLPAGQSHSRSLALRFEAGVSLPFGREPHFWQIWDSSSPLYECWDDFVEVTHPEKHVGQLGGFALDARADSIELYRRVALSQLGRRAMLDADRWPSLEAYEREIKEQEHSRFDKPEENLYLHEIRELRPKVEWIVEHRAEIQAEASRWRLLFDIHTDIKSRLDFGGVEHLFLFIPSSDLAQGRFDRIVAVMRP